MNKKKFLKTTPRQKQKLLLVILLSILFLINYNFLENSVKNFFDESEHRIVERVIDGDTIVVENNTHIRLLGINTPEKGEFYYPESKEFLEELMINKTVKLEYGKEKYDMYNRTLAYVFLEKENINLKLVEKGFANFYFPSGKDRYYNGFSRAWENCIKNNVNLCEKSENKCARCVKLKEFDYKKEMIILENLCGFDCELTNWEIKDEGRKKFIFPDFELKDKESVKISVGEGENTKNNLFWAGETYVWTKTGDTLFLRDDAGKLILWETY